MMVTIECSPGQCVRIGHRTMRVLAVHAAEVILALIDPDKDCALCGERPANRHYCPVCASGTVICPACTPDWCCPRCG